MLPVVVRRQRGSRQRTRRLSDNERRRVGCFYACASPAVETKQQNEPYDQPLTVKACLYGNAFGKIDPCLQEKLAPLPLLRRELPPRIADYL